MCLEGFDVHGREVTEKKGLRIEKMSIGTCACEICVGMLGGLEIEKD